MIQQEARRVRRVRTNAGFFCRDLNCFGGTRARWSRLIALTLFHAWVARLARGWSPHRLTSINSLELRLRGFRGSLLVAPELPSPERGAIRVIRGIREIVVHIVTSANDREAGGPRPSRPGAPNQFRPRRKQPRSRPDSPSPPSLLLNHPAVPPAVLTLSRDQSYAPLTHRPPTHDSATAA